MLCLEQQGAAYRGIACREVQDAPHSLATSMSWGLTSSTSPCSLRPTQVGCNADPTAQAVMHGTGCAVVLPSVIHHKRMLMRQDMGHAACQG